MEDLLSSFSVGRFLMLIICLLFNNEVITPLFYNNDLVTDLPLLNHYRVERAAGRRAKMSRLPHVDDEALKQSVKFSESNLGRETRMENSLVWSNTKVRQDSPQHGQLITSCPSDEAMRLGKDALIATKASLYISHKHCQR